MAELKDAHQDLVACTHCDALSPKPKLAPGHKAICSRCDNVLLVYKKDSINRTLAIATAGLVFFVPAMTLPIIGVGLVGLYNEASLVECIQDLVANDFPVMALCTFLFTIAIPFVRLFTAFVVTVSIKLGMYTPGLLQFFRSYHTLDKWVMLNVFLLGVIISMYKITDLAELSVGLGLLAFTGYLICSTFISVTFDPHYVWDKLEYELARTNR
ncbi:paraquat-inducible protein A [Thalassotalea agarivorans]|uniref:Paraquat-inducible protein A n=1 Tax=Thalassotalea agarivorans TaxID=349064 RepID=A0A1I0CVQ4_THASX|nr:paraquat-inducible protein A [Thalassotalea agarivorans]SET23843.1 paraquat-inducible protein A [Thalassotalea agarivorans]